MQGSLAQMALLVLGWNAVMNVAFAWENLPEFQSLSEVEAGGFEGPGMLNSEYFSDLQAYGVTPDWESRWLAHTKALQIDFGSLNTTRFAIDNRLKIHQPILERFEVRFTYFEELDLERQSNHYVLELVFNPWKFLGLVFYGEPSFRKPNDDTGVAILLRPSEQHEIRFFNTFVDVTRLKYPDTPDTFLEPDVPASRGVVGRMWSNPPSSGRRGDFVEYALRYEVPTRWQFFGQNYIYSYWKGFASFYASQQMSSDSSAAFRFEFDRKHETREAIAPTTAVIGDWFTNRVTVLAESTFYSKGPNHDWEITPGLQLASRQWISNQGNGSYRDLLPYLRFKIPAWGPPSAKDAWVLGYSLAWHRELGSPQIGIRPEKDGSVEQRLNVSYEFSFGDRGKLVLFASADLDQFGTGGSWGGGCGQLELFF